MNDLTQLKLSRMKAGAYQAEAERNRLLEQLPKQGLRFLLAQNLVRLARWLSPAHAYSQPPKPAINERVRC